MFSTRIRFLLPSYYNYGVGSAGFGSLPQARRHGHPADDRRLPDGFPERHTLPLATNLNFDAGQTVANLVVA